MPSLGISISVSPLPPNGPYDFVREWTQYAEESGRDLFFKFFCYFLAFNHLYESRDLWNHDKYAVLRNQERISDLDKVVAFLTHVFIDDQGPKLSVAVSEEEYDLLITVEWHNYKTGRWCLDRPHECYDLRHKVEQSKDVRYKTMLALTKVYRVRCNLFHGDKHVTCDRDRQLVEISSELLCRFLASCMDANLGMEHLWIERKESENV